MAHYYELIAGLTELNVEQTTIPLSSKQYLNILENTLTSSDKRILDFIRLDNTLNEIINAISNGKVEAIAKDPEQEIDEDESVLNVELNDIRYRSENKLPLQRKDSVVPLEIKEIIYKLYSGEYEQGKENLIFIHNIYIWYYEKAQKSNSVFLCDWFSLNKNIKNITSLFICEKLGWNHAEFVLGNLPIDNKIRDLGLNGIKEIEGLDYLDDIINVAKETDITKRERLIDLIKWRFLEKYNYEDVFCIENVISYYIKLCILERWINLNEAQGETKFRSIVASLKETSKISLQEFKNKQRK